MAQKCVHKGCGKLFTGSTEECIYHPGPPDFHEGQKGWKCCKPRVLTFDEFLSIPPCTTGHHSTVDETAAAEAAKPATAPPPPPPTTRPITSTNGMSTPTGVPQQQTPTAAVAPESDSDEDTASVVAGTTCKRRGCGVTSSAATVKSREGETCAYHPGQALFHEGSKGWTCCKKRVLEFDEFMKIAGCKTRTRHCFVGKTGKRRKPGQGDDNEEYDKIDTLRHDFYQTPSLVHASLYLKKVDKEKSLVVFEEDGARIRLDLRTGDGKMYQGEWPLFAKIEPGKSTFKILGTKVDMTLAKADGVGWPVLRSDEKLTGEIIQTGRAGRA